MIDLVFQSLFTQVGPGMDPLDSHLPQGDLDAGSSHKEALPFENGRHAATSVEWPTGIDGVDPVPKGLLLC